MNKIQTYITSYQYVGCISKHDEIGFFEPVFKRIDILGRVSDDMYRGVVDGNGQYIQFQPITIFQSTIYKEQNHRKIVRVKIGDKQLFAIIVGHDVGIECKVGEYPRTRGHSCTESSRCYCYVGTETSIAQILQHVLEITKNVAFNPTSTKQLRSWYTFLQDYDKLAGVFFVDFLDDVINPVCCMGYFDTIPFPDKLNDVLTRKNPTLGEMFWQEYLQNKSLSLKKMRKLFDVEKIMLEYKWLFDDWMQRGYIDTQIDILERNGIIKIQGRWNIGTSQARHCYSYSDKIKIVINHTIKTYLKVYLSERIRRESIINEKMNDVVQAKAILENYLLPHQDVVIEQRCSGSTYDTWLCLRTRYESKKDNDSKIRRKPFSNQDSDRLRELGFRENTFMRAGDFEREIRWGNKPTQYCVEWVFSIV